MYSTKVKKNINECSNILSQICFKLQSFASNYSCLLLVLNCPRLEYLEFNHHGFVLREFIDVISNENLKNGRTFNLKAIFLPILKSDTCKPFLGVLNLLPQLEQLKLWTTSIDTK